MKTIFHQPVDEPRIKRGDLLQTNLGNRRERTFLMLATHLLPTRFCREMGVTTRRTRVWAERWWQLEVPLRLALAASAERNGGQRCFRFMRFSRKQKPDFETFMRRGAQRQKENDCG